MVQLASLAAAEISEAQPSSSALVPGSAQSSVSPLAARRVSPAELLPHAVFELVYRASVRDAPLRAAALRQLQHVHEHEPVLPALFSFGSELLATLAAPAGGKWRHTIIILYYSSIILYFTLLLFFL